MPWTTLYHATNSDAATQIDYEGFRAGPDGHQGGAVYLSDSPKEAKYRSRNGREVVYKVQVQLHRGHYGYDGKSYAIYSNDLIKSYSRV
eukprot:6062194-Prymnesium_polylepis.1